jgi:hypothetical protein
MLGEGIEQARRIVEIPMGGKRRSLCHRFGAFQGVKIRFDNGPPGCRDGNRRYARKTGMRSRPCAVSYRKPNTRQAFWQALGRPWAGLGQAVGIFRRELLKQLSRCVSMRERGRINILPRADAHCHERPFVCVCTEDRQCVAMAELVGARQRRMAKRGTGAPRIWSAGFRFALEPLCLHRCSPVFFFLPASRDAAPPEAAFLISARDLMQAGMAKVNGGAIP